MIHKGVSKHQILMTRLLLWHLKEFQLIRLGSILVKKWNRFHLKINISICMLKVLMMVIHTHMIVFGKMELRLYAPTPLHQLYRVVIRSMCCFGLRTLKCLKQKTHQNQLIKHHICFMKDIITSHFKQMLKKLLSLPHNKS